MGKCANCLEYFSMFITNCSLGCSILYVTPDPVATLKLISYCKQRIDALAVALLEMQTKIGDAQTH